MARKTVFITGAAKRLGQAIALFFARKGYNLVLHYHQSHQDIKETKKQCEALGVNVTLVQANLFHETEIRTLFTHIPENFLPLHALINNAALFINDTFDDLPPDVWQKHMMVNTRAPLLLSLAFAKQLPKKEKGIIINMLDYCVWNPPSHFISYTLSKMSLWHLTVLLAKQLAPAIRVNGIGPGNTLPNAQETEQHFRQARLSTLVENGADPDEICRAIDFILHASSFTGQMLALDGGKFLSHAAVF